MHFPLYISIRVHNFIGYARCTHIFINSKIESLEWGTNNDDVGKSMRLTQKKKEENNE